MGFLILGLVYASYTGLWKGGEARWRDSRMYYVAGAALESGKSPYNAQVLREVWPQAIGKDVPFTVPTGGMAITPSTGPFLAAFGKVPWEIARWAFDIFSLIFGLGGVVYFLHKLDRDRHGGAFTEPRTLIASTGVCFISGVPAALYLGQPSLITMAGVLGAMFYATKEKPIAVAIFLYFASFKVQLALLPLFYLVVFGIFRPFIAGAALILVTSAWTLFTVPATNLMQDIATTSQAYLARGANRPPLVTGLHSLIVSLGGGSSILVWLIVSLGIVSGPAIVMRLKNEISAKRKRDIVYGELWLLPFVATGVFIQLKPYDSIIFAPVLYWLLRRGNCSSVLYFPGILLAVRPGLPAILFADYSNSVLLLPAQVITVASIYLLLCLLWRLLRYNKDPIAD